MKYIYVLDFSQSKIFEIETSEINSTGSNTEEILMQYGLRDSDCQWMISDNKLELETINKIN